MRGAEMPKLPKLKVKRTFGYTPGEGQVYPTEETYDFEQAKSFPYDHIGTLILVENQVINSYDELVQLASQDYCRDKEFLEVIMAPLIGAGG